MDHRQFVKKLTVPDGATVPRRLVFDDVVALPLTREHLEDDVAGINASLDVIRRTRGGPWPTGPVTEDDNYIDLVWHECEFRDESSFTYVLELARGGYIGCAYLYPMGRRTELTRDLLDHDVDVSWWVTGAAHADGYYSKVYEALLRWVEIDLPFNRPFFSNWDVPAL